MLLTGDASTYGTQNPARETVCKRDGNDKILFAGDLCSVTDMPASGTCFDAVRFSASFAESSVAMTN